jgi:hypothetical protein
MNSLFSYVDMCMLQERKVLIADHTPPTTQHARDSKSVFLSSEKVQLRVIDLQV